MPDPRSAARTLLYAALATLLLLPLACHSARAEEVVRVAVDRPATVIVERTPEGGIRVILEYRPKAAPVPPGAPTMADVVDRALGRPGVATYRDRILGEVAAAVDAALEAAEAGRVDSVGTAYAMVSTATIHGLDNAPAKPGEALGTALAGPIAELAGALMVGAGDMDVRKRLAEFKRIIEERAGS